jgi:Mg2+/Co2+ transporter CorB
LNAADLQWPVSLPVGPIVTAALLIVVMALLSLGESALLNVNRYQLRTLARLGNAGARRTELLLAQADRLSVTILLSRISAAVSAAAFTGIACWPLGGFMMAAGIVVLVLFMMVFGEIAPRAVGARFPERIAITSGWFYAGLMPLLHPVIWLITHISEIVLRILGAPGTSASLPLNAKDGAPEAPSHKRMVARILELQSVTVEDIMVPRNEISSVDIEDDWDSILDLLRTTPHTRLPLCEGNLDNVVGMLHMKKVAHAFAHGEISREALLRVASEREAYFVPEGTTLDVQLHNFQRDRRRIALVVDEYGDIRGLVTLEDILEEIVGEFTSDPGTLHKDIHEESDGSYVINGGINVRVLNRSLGWNLPTDGPRTLNGLILEYLENIPEPGTSLRLGDLSIEILQAIDNAVRTARIRRIDEHAEASDETAAQR